MIVVEATEEAVYDSLFCAESVTGRGGRTVDALPIDRTIEIMPKYDLLNLQERLLPF